MASQPRRPVFSLLDHTGRAVSDADFHGRYSLVFFGFTNCAVVCPRALSRLTKILEGLGTYANNINALYVSVDPARDTPEVMAKFLEKYPRFTGLTGTEAQVKSACESFGVFAKPKDDPLASDGYVVPHTAITYLLGPDGQLLDHYNDSIDAKEVTARVSKMISDRVAHASNGGRKEATDVPLASGLKESLQLLDEKQVATIRHIGNLARQLKGDWSNMMGRTHLNDGFGGYRFQLAYGYYALTLAHFHRLPAAPGYFRDTMERIMEKMLDPDVWFYWHDASKGGGFLQTPTSEGSFDPVKTDNIMYSAYLQTMSAMYNSLFDDKRYQKPGALTLAYDMFLWGPLGGCKFEYDQNSVNETIYWNMVKEGYIGVACEPYCIFQICNQVPILGFRLNDAVNGETHTAEEVTQGYVKAWTETGGGIVNPDGIFNTVYAKHINQTVVIPQPNMDAWCGTLMNAWNHDLVEQTYKNQLERLLVRNDDGTLGVRVHVDKTSPSNTTYMDLAGAFGWMPAWAAEMGDEATRDGLLAFADKHFRPRVQNGGLMYPRNDEISDENENCLFFGPIESNALIPLARLNVRHGLKRFYEQPWGAKSRQHYSEPALSHVDFEVDVYRAVYIASTATLLFDIAVYEKGVRASVVLSRIFGRGAWKLERDGVEIARGDDRGLKSASSEGGVEQDADTLRLGVASTEVASYVLQWSSSD